MSRLIRVFRAAAQRFSAEGSAFMAQAIAFTALFALLPLTLVTVAMLAFIYGTDEGIARAHAVIQLYVPQIQDLIANNLDSIVRYRGITGIIGLLGLVWSGKNLFQALTYALNRSLQLSDESLIERMNSKMAVNGYRMNWLVETIVTSPQFLNARR